MICPHRRCRRLLWKFKAWFGPPPLATLVLTGLLAGIGSGTAVAVPEPASGAVTLVVLIASRFIHCRQPGNRLRFPVE